MQIGMRQFVKTSNKFESIWKVRTLGVAAQEENWPQKRWLNKYWYCGKNRNEVLPFSPSEQRWHGLCQGPRLPQREVDVQVSYINVHFQQACLGRYNATCLSRRRDLSS